MTFVLALGNREQIIQLSDRRLTRPDGTTMVLPETKTTIVTLGDSRLICGFAGLAKAQGFRTSDWILDALAGAASKDHLALGTVERFTEEATAKFREPTLAQVPRASRALSVLFTGYNDTRDPPAMIAAWVTNFQNLETGQDEEPWDEFRVKYWSLKPPSEEPNPTWIQRVGQWPAMTNGDEQKLRRALDERRTALALAEMGVGVMREIAARPEAQGRIGKDISSAVLPAERPPEIQRGTINLSMGPYFPEGASQRWVGVNQVVSMDGLELMMKDPILAVADPDGSPVAVQKVGRNKPCPCGSGKKYKKCHGAPT